MIADPLGRSGRNLEVTYQVYLADYDYLADIQGLFEGSGIQEIEFYPAVRAYAEALDVERAERDFALVDLGAMGVNVVLFRDGSAFADRGTDDRYRYDGCFCLEFRTSP